MADLVRALDWSKTSLGPIEDWSETLVTTVNLVLASRHPMFLWWGSDLIQFYNDGYRPSLGAGKHPSALGQRGVDCWPEIWPIIGPQIEAVMDRGESTWHTNQLVPIHRNGRLEEVFWTYSYSPVRGRDGTVHGTLVVCSETTEQVLSERRLRALLAVAISGPVQDERSDAHPLIHVGRQLIYQLRDAADLPFTALYVSIDGELVPAGSTDARETIADARHWPLAEVASSQTPLLLDDLPQRLGHFVLPPWPEPVTRAYLLPLRLPSSIQAVLVFGISPRLPFDHSYETFCRLVGARIASLLQSEIQKLEVAESARRFSRLAEANPFGTIIGSLDGVLEYVNPAFLKTLGYSEDDVSAGNLRWDVLTPPEHAALDARAVQQLRERGSCDVYEKSYIARDGRRVPILIGAASIGTSRGKQNIAAFVTDLTDLKLAQEALRGANAELESKIAERTAALEAEISDRKRAEAGLRELTGRLLQTRDEERRHMARELHDNAGQTLVALGLNLSALMQLAKGKENGIVELLMESQKLSADLSTEIRTLSYLLHPPLLDEAGLGSALQWYVEGFSKRSKIAVDLDLPGDLSRLPRELELVLFRTVQESLTNVHRHSGSSRAAIRLVQSASRVQIEISDWGSGIPAERMSQMNSKAKLGVGIRGMRERVGQFGGALRIDSSPAGTTVSVQIPLENHKISEGPETHPGPS